MLGVKQPLQPFHCPAVRRAGADGETGRDKIHVPFSQPAPVSALKAHLLKLSVFDNVLWMDIFEAVACF